MTAIRKLALVVGGSGLVGTNLLDHLFADGGWDVITVSRRPVAGETRARHVALDLLDPVACKAKASEMAGVTHVFYLSRFVEDGYAIKVGPNVAMLEHLMDALEPVAPGLQHVHILHGCKWYGVHLGAFRTPARETDPRPDTALYYYGQHDFIRERQRGKAWTWSTLRPHYVDGVAVGSPSNLVGAVGAYAAIMRELDLPLRFPGSQAAYEAILMHVDVRLLARAMTWVATEPRCGNEDFNIANGDFFRWREVWPRIAEFFGMRAAGPEPLSLREFMKDKAPVWERLQRRHGLTPIPFQQAADWAFTDALFRLEWDQAMSVVKMHRFGFHEMVDSEQMLLDILQTYRDQRLLP